MRILNSIFLSFYIAASGEAFKYFMVGKKNGPWCVFRRNVHDTIIY